MKRLLLGMAAVILLGLGSGRSAFADPSLELVAGTGANMDIIYWDGVGAVACSHGGVAVSCATFGTVGTLGSAASGSETLAVTAFHGWKITQTSGGSNSPNCVGFNGPDCINEDNINANTLGGATDDLQAYFGASGFGTQPGLKVTESGSAAIGTATAKGFAYTGALGFSALAAPTVSGQIGATLSVSNCAPCMAGPPGGPSPTGPFHLAIVDIFFGAAGNTFNVDTTIAAVSAPASMVLFGSLFLAVTALGKKKLRRR